MCFQVFFFEKLETENPSNTPKTLCGALKSTARFEKEVGNLLTGRKHRAKLVAVTEAEVKSQRVTVLC